MVFLLLSCVFLILRSYSFFSPGAVVLAFSLVLFPAKNRSEIGSGRFLFLTVFTLFFLALSGFDASNAGDLLDLLCIHCSGILYLRSAGAALPASNEKKTEITGSIDEKLLRYSVFFLLFWILLFRIWYQSEPGFWKEFGSFYLCKSGILSGLLGFLWFRNGKSKTTTFFFSSMLLCVLLVHPSQGILNFSYFLLFSFLQADPESKKINVGIDV